MDIVADLITKPYQLWLIIGGVLLAAELLGTAGYALWSGVSAVIVALIAYLFPMSWQLQWITFAVLGIIVAILWWKWSQSRTHKIKSANLLNRPYLSLIGTQCTLIEPIQNGYGRVKLADGSWRVKSDSELPVGAIVIVEAVEGNTLVVKAK
jgi:membrane protein implicated in regulation of membrane protease activity